MKSSFLILSFFFISIKASPTRLEAVNPGHAVCTGENVTYMCSVSGELVTWYIQLGNNYNFDEFTETATTTERIFDNILWRRVEYDSNNNVLQSTITFPAAVGMIACGNGSSSPTYNVSEQVQVEGHPSAPDRPTTSKNNIVRFNDSYSSVTVSWERPDTNNSRISRYVVSVNPQIALPGNGIIAATDPDFQDRQITVLLKHEQAYDIFVRADNCNNSQQGSRSSALHINIQVPPPTSSCTVIPVYDYYYNHLQGIDIKWERIQDPLNQITPEITAHIQSYQVRLISTASTCSAGITTDISSSLHCTTHITLGDLSTLCRDNCVYTFQNTSELTALYYSVLVTAKNLLDYGESQRCGNYNIGSRNDVVDVDIKQCRNGTEVVCRFYDDILAEASCEIAYGTDPTRAVLPFTDVSDTIATGRDTIRIMISQPLDPNTNYFYNVTMMGESVQARVLGTFQTGGQCQARDLGTTTVVNNAECRTREGTVSISNGIICYTGTTYGSLAYTVCDEGYELSSASGKIVNLRECLQNGQWSEIHVICINSTANKDSPSTVKSLEDTLHTCSTILSVFAAVCFVVFFPVGAVIGALVTYFAKLKFQRKTETERAEPYYDYIGRSDRIETDTNMSYIQTAPPPVPMNTPITKIE